LPISASSSSPEPTGRRCRDCLPRSLRPPAHPACSFGLNPQSAKRAGFRHRLVVGVALRLRSRFVLHFTSPSDRWPKPSQFCRQLFTTCHSRGVNEQSKSAPAR
jgi:hypothetical protein